MSGGGGSGNAIVGHQTHCLAGRLYPAEEEVEEERFRDSWGILSDIWVMLGYPSEIY